MVREVILRDGEAACVPNVGGQAAFVDDWTHHNVALAGGWAAGKTWAGARKLLQLHMINAMAPVFAADGSVSHHEPSFVPSAIIAPSYRNAWDYDIPAFLEACEEVGLKARMKTVEMEIHLDDLGTKARPSSIMIRTADAPRRITGWEVGAAWGDEVTRWKEDRTNPKDDPLIQLMGCVRHPAAVFTQMILTFTHEGDMTEVLEIFREGDPGEFALYEVPTSQNPIMAGWEQQQRRVLSADLVAQYLDAKPLNVRGGSVYKEFSKALHVDDSLELDPDRDLHLSLDFNIAPGMHGEIGQYIEERDLFITTHEIHAPRMDVQQLVVVFGQWLRDHGWLKRLSGPTTRRQLHIFGDATGRSQWAGTSESCYHILRDGLNSLGINYRVRVPKANPFVADRVNAFRVALVDLDDVVHWKCRSCCTRLVTDLTKLKRKSDGEIDKSNQSLSHPSDAEGYRVSYLRPARVRSGSSVAGRFSVATRN